MAIIEIYTSKSCVWCERAKTLLRDRGYRFICWDVGGDRSLHAEFTKRTNGALTVPQIFVGARHVGGFQELAAADISGELQQLIGGQ